MVIYSSIPARVIPRTEGACWAIVHCVADLNMIWATEHMLSFLMNATTNPRSVSWSSYLKTYKVNIIVQMGKETEIQISTDLLVSDHSAWSHKQPETQKCAIGVYWENFKICTYFWLRSWKTVPKGKESEKGYGREEKNHQFSTISLLLLLLLFLLLMTAVDSEAS